MGAVTFFFTFTFASLARTFRRQWQWSCVVPFLVRLVSFRFDVPPLLVSLWPKKGRTGHLDDAPPLQRVGQEEWGGGRLVFV